ncbi:MAG: GGDEF domain-containing protein [Alphaproteobacteria bacterium]
MRRRKTMGPTVRDAWRALWPSLGLLALAAGVALGAAGELFAVPAIPTFLPVAIAAGAALLAIWLGRFNVVLTLAAVAVAFVALDANLPAAPGADAHGRILYPALALLLPLNIALFAVARERGILTPRGLAKAGFLILQIVGVAGLVWAATPELEAAADAWLHARPLPREADLWTHLPQPALLVYPLASIVLLARLWRSGSPLDAGALSGLVATAWALHAVAEPLLRDLLATTALAALALGLVQESHRLAFVDELTGLPGRRALEAALAKAGRRYAVAMVDIDHFKRFNDSHGHDVGDQVLRLVASRLAGVGGGGRAYRYGGEEFTILFPGRSAESCVGLLERCREAVAAAEFRTRGKGRPAKPPKAGRPRRKADGAALSVTVSMGLAERGADGGQVEAVLKAADQALYRAKRAGRDRLARARA